MASGGGKPAYIRLSYGTAPNKLFVVKLFLRNQVLLGPMYVFHFFHAGL
jgi:hypothetical protein